MGLRTKILVLMTMPVLVLAATVAFGFRAESSTTESLRLVQHTYQVKEALGAVVEDLVNAESGMRGYLLTGENEFPGPLRRGDGTPQSGSRPSGLPPAR